jgi:hypothetical protein
VSGEPDAAIVVVSGLPRSGTSLMMQMLAAGGLPPLCDGVRAADAQNPRGYLEWEPIKGIAAHPERIARARGRAVEVISALLPALPPPWRYRVVFMERDPVAVEASQRAMLARRGAPADDVTAAELARHLARTRAWLAAQPRFATCFVAYEETLARPRETAARVRDFLGLELDAERMAAAVDPSLRRQPGPARRWQRSI